MRIVQRREQWRRDGISLLAMLALTSSAWAQRANETGTWKPAPAPLMTRFAKDVSPDNPRPEYPRPLIVRKEWQSLNGLWQFAFDDKNQGAGKGWQSGKNLPEKILVPFTFEAALSGIGKGKEIHEHLWYRRQFTVPHAWNGKHTLLHFGAVDWKTTVWVNGKPMGEHTGGYAPFTFDITPALKTDGPQEIVVAVYDPADPKGEGWQPKGKQLGSESIWYTRTTGIWQTVWLEPVAPFHISTMSVSATDVKNENQGEVNTLVSPVGTGTCQIDMTVSYKGHVVGHEVTPSVQSSFDSLYLEATPRERHFGGLGATMRVPKPEHWTPENPALYDVDVKLLQSGKVVDEVKTYTAFRTVGMAKGRLTLNGKPYFYRGVLDQGFWPDGIYTPPTDAAIKNDVEMIKKLGFNMARKHVKVEDPRWYYWCDRLGVAVWQDMPSSHNLSKPEAQENFQNEWREIVANTHGYPCIVHWIPFNENWGNPGAFQDKMVEFTRQLDPTRLITDASGWTQRGLTDVIDAHDYGNNLIHEGVQHPVKPKVVGEYGGIALPIPEHTWSKGWGYQSVRSPEGLVQRVRYQTSQLFEAANLSGFVYTQLTDVEQELNGLMTYDRLPKAAPKDIAPVFEGRSRSQKNEVSYLHDWLVLGPIPAGTSFNAAEDSPANRARMERLLNKPFLPNEAELQPTQNAGATAEGKPYSWVRVVVNEDQLDFHKVFGGEKNNAVAYAVTYLDSPREIKNVTLLFGSDDGAVVWLNGKKVWTTTHIRGVNPDEDTIPNLTLKQGRNVLVVKVGQGVGGWGTSARFELPDGKPLQTTNR